MSENLKVHFVVPMQRDPDKFAMALMGCGVRYALFSCYPMIKDTGSDEDMRVSDLSVAKWGFKHMIMDSGLFTMMFGADSGRQRSPDDIREWMLRICRFVEDNDIDASIVECDCQKLFGPELAWELRREMRERLQDREIINVFHLEDGEDGFMQLVEYSDYLAISVPELRIAQPKRYRNTVCALTRLAHREKPGIKIHLLGCTERELLKRNAFCATADSSSWTAGARFGSFDGDHHISTIKPDKQIAAMNAMNNAAKAAGIREDECEPGSKHMTWMAANFYNAMFCRESYIMACGSQD